MATSIAIIVGSTYRSGSGGTYVAAKNNCQLLIIINYYQIITLILYNE